MSLPSYAMWLSALLGGAALGHATPLPRMEYTSTDHIHPLCTLQLSPHLGEKSSTTLKNFLSLYRHLRPQTHSTPSTFAIPTILQANPPLIITAMAISSANRVFALQALHRMHLSSYYYHPFFAVHCKAKTLEIVRSIRPHPSLLLTNGEPHKEEAEQEDKYFCHSFFAPNVHKSQIELLHLLPWRPLLQKVSKEDMPVEVIAIIEKISEEKPANAPLDIIGAFATSVPEKAKSSPEANTSDSDRKLFFKYAHILPKRSHAKKCAKTTSKASKTSSKTAQNKPHSKSQLKPQVKPRGFSRHLHSIRSYLDR